MSRLVENKMSCFHVQQISQEESAVIIQPQNQYKSPNSRK